MNPFLIFIILIPLLVSLLFLGLLVLQIIKNSFGWDVLVFLVLLSAISYFLITFLRRSMTSKGALMAFPGDDKVPENSRKKITNFILGNTYVVLLVLFLVTFNFLPVRNWLGIMEFILGLALLLSGVGRFRSAKEIQPDFSAPAVTNKLEHLEKTLSLHQANRNPILILNVFSGIGCTFLYFILHGERYFSLLDLLGFLFLLGSVCIWQVLYGKSIQGRITTLKQELETYKEKVNKS